MFQALILQNRNLILLAILCLLSENLINAATPVFIKAIQSALGSIPLGGFPMSAGLTSAKLAVGGKLLYFLGMFGKNPASQNPGFLNSGGFNGMSDFPGNFPGSNQFGQQAFGQSAKVQSKPPVNPAAVMTALSQQGINPLQLMQALESAGVDSTQMLQALSGGTGGNGAFSSMPPMSSGPGKRAGQGRPPQTQFNPFPSTGQMNEMPHDLSNSLPPDSENLVNQPSDPEADESEDVESFFSFMKDMDDNKCISRLICDIGNNPNFLGEFSRNIDNIISTLEVSPESGAYDYIQIMENGRNGENCAVAYSQCDDEAYDIVKSVAPSVGVPSGVTAEAINKL